MKVFCKECKIALSKELVELTDSKLLNEGDEKPFIPASFFTKSDGEFFTGTKDKLIINLNDLINIKNHPDFKRLNGCCGLDGLDGLNKVCVQGHEIGTAKEDCWMPHCVIFETSRIILK